MVFITPPYGCGGDTGGTPRTAFPTVYRAAKLRDKLEFEVFGHRKISHAAHAAEPAAKRYIIFLLLCVKMVFKIRKLQNNGIRKQILPEARNINAMIMNTTKGYDIYNVL